MRTTPTGQRSTPNNGDDPSTTKKNVDAALDNHPNRPQSATKPAREPSPAATIPRPVSPRTQRSDKPPSGRTGSRKGRKNPLAGPDDDLPPPPPPPPPAASAAELEAEFVQAQTAQVADDEEAEAAAALGAAPTEGEKSDAPSTNANPEDNANGSVELPAAAKRTIATSVLLGILTLLPLAAVIALAVLQGPLVDQRAMRQGGVMEDLCLTSVSRVAIALQVETRASEDLLVFHVRPNPITTPASVINAANVSTDAFVAARAAYEAAIKATDIQLDALWKQWADTGSSFTGQFTDLGVHAFDDAPAPSATVTTTTVSPWVALREAAASQTRRYDATASPSMSLSRAFDSAALSTVRQYVFAGTPAFRTTPTYAALSRQLPSLCAVALGIEYAPRLGDGSTLASSGALASTLGDHAVRLSSGVATAGDGAIQEASGRVLATWDAIGLRAAARAFPVPLSSVATESMGFQAVLPSAVVDTTSSNLGAQLAQLSPDVVDTIRDQQRQLLGAATALLDSVAKTDKSSVWMTQAVASAVTLWIAVAALALSTLIMVIHSAHEATKRDSYEALDRELRSAEQAMSRMRQTAAKIRCLKLNVVAAFRRRARVARSEETTLYSALSNLRDIESYLPQAITVPPKETPAEALNQDGLNVRPHLHSVRGVAALRIDLSQHHRKFNDADSKKQAVHHHLVRFLATVDEAVHTVVPSGLVTVHGFYVMVWINVNEDVEYPCSAALHVAIEVTDKSMEVFGIVPSIAVVHADLVVGTVGALTATADPAAMQELNAYLGSAASASGTPPSTGNTVQVGDSDAPTAAPLSSDLPQHKAFKAFTTFGPLNEDADMLVAMARLHNVHIVCNQSVARQVYAELKLYNNANAAHYGHHRVEEAGARKHTPGALPALIQFRGLELVANAHVEGDAASIDGETATAPASQATGASMVHSQMGKLDHRVHNSQIILELVRRVTNDKKEGPKVDEWNKLTRYYCNGNLRQAASVLKRWVEIFGSCESAVRMQRLIAVAELVHGPGDASKLSRPFVASYHEIMRDALVEVA